MSKKNNNNELAEKLGKILLERKLRCAVAESCTGGSLAAAITEIAGSSQWFDRGFVTYANEAKEDMLAVPVSVILSQGAVSEATVRAMAQGAIAASNAEVSVAISGIAGPGGGSHEKPIGTVWIAWAGDLQPTYAQCYFFEGDRAAIRKQAVLVALEGLIQRCEVNVSQINNDRYFFALWPDAKTAHALYNHGIESAATPMSHSVVLENLHMTLVYLGQTTPVFLQNAQKVASKLRAAPFELSIVRANSWPEVKVRWLGLESTPPELEQLVKGLNHDLIAVGFKPEKKPFIPHVTIERHCTQGGASEFIQPLSWFVNEVCLVKSIKSLEFSKYEIIQRWPLGDSSSKFENCVNK